MKLSFSRTLIIWMCLFLCSCTKVNSDDMASSMYARIDYMRVPEKTTEAETFNYEEFLAELREREAAVKTSDTVEVGQELNIKGCIVKVSRVDFFDNLYDVEDYDSKYSDEIIKRLKKYEMSLREYYKNPDIIRTVDLETGRFVNEELVLVEYSFDNSNGNLGGRVDIFPMFTAIRPIGDDGDFKLTVCPDYIRLYSDDYQFDHKDPDGYWIDISKTKSMKILMCATVSESFTPKQYDVKELFLSFSHFYSVNLENDFLVKVYEKDN